MIVDYDYSVHMVGHYYPFVQFNVIILPSQPFPCFGNHSPLIIQHHLPIYNFAKEALPVLRANGHKIPACLGIIIILQSYRSAMMNIGIVCHDLFFYVLFVFIKGRFANRNYEYSFSPNPFLEDSICFTALSKSLNSVLDKARRLE